MSPSDSSMRRASRIVGPLIPNSARRPSRLGRRSPSASRPVTINSRMRSATRSAARGTWTWPLASGAFDRWLRGPSNTSNVLTHSPDEGGAMTSVDYGLVDSDNHYYEAEDAFTRHGDDEVSATCGGYRRQAAPPHVRQRGGGGHPEPDVQPDREARFVPRPPEGAAEHGKRTQRAPVEKLRRARAAARRVPRPRRAPRTMDEQGVERTVFFPTLGVGIDGLKPTTCAWPTRCSTRSTCGSTTTGASTATAASMRRPTSRCSIPHLACRGARRGARARTRR